MESRALRVFRLVLALTLEQGGDLSHLSATSRISNFWEQLGSLVRARHVGRRQITEAWGDIILIYWTMLEPSVRNYESSMGWTTS